MHRKLGSETMWIRDSLKKQEINGLMRKNDLYDEISLSV